MEAFSREKRPNWAGGDPRPYGPGWAAVRRQALKRDDYRCQVCGTTKEELDRNPDVHHIVPVRVFEAANGHSRENAHRLDNVITLSVDCHRKADFGKLPVAELRSLIAE